MPFNKGDFTQQGVAGHVNANLRLNEKRLVNIDLTSNEEAAGCTITGTVKDLLNNQVYGVGAGVSGNIEITENGENINVAPFATATVNVSGGGGFPTCEITLVPHERGSQFAGYNALSPNFCLDANGKLMANIDDYQTNLVVNALYATVGGSPIVTYNNMNQYLSEADALASVTDKVNITAVAFENDGRYFVGIMPTDDTLPSSCTMTGDEK